MAEPFTGMLTELLHRIDGAVGAAFIDRYGEAVESISSRNDEEYIQLMGAYQGIAFQTSRGIVTQLDAGDIDFFYTSYDNVSFLIKALSHDYFIMLVLGPNANMGQGIFYVSRVASAFNKEI